MQKMIANTSNYDSVSPIFELTGQSSTINSKKVWLYIKNEVEDFLDTCEVVIFDYYARFNMFVARCVFIEMPSLVLKSFSRLKSTVFGTSLDPSTKKKLDDLWSKNKNADELDVDEVRWFMRNYNSNWIPMKGYDSIMLEISFRSQVMNQEGRDEFFQGLSDLYNIEPVYFTQCTVLKGLYQPTQDFNNLEPVYWNDTFDRIQIRRSTNFTSNLAPVFDEKLKNNSKVDYIPAKFYENKPDFDHLIFVIHGNLRNPISMREFSSRVQKLMETLPSAHEDDQKRFSPMVIPIEWRSGLEMPESYVELMSTSNKELASSQAGNLKTIEAMYCMSPGFQNKAADGVISILNQNYDKFLQSHPTFSQNNCQISIIGHGLGSVIVYDAITGYRATQLSDLLHRKSLGRNLKFQVANAFLVGSPLSLFAASREIDLTETISKSSCRFFNIMHPLDPVTYRIEPYFHEDFSKVQPEPIYPCYAMQVREYFGEMEPDYMYCFMEEARKIQERWKKVVTNEKRLKERMDFYVIPRKKDEKRLKSGESHEMYWDNVAMVNFIRDSIHDDTSNHHYDSNIDSASYRLQTYHKSCCQLYSKDLTFFQRIKTWFNLYFKTELKTTFLLVSGHFLITIFPTLITIKLLQDEKFPSMVMEKLVLYPYTSFLQPILMSSYKFPMFIYGLYSMNLPFIIMPVLFYSNNNPMIIEASIWYQIVVSPLFMGVTALVCYSWPYMKRRQNNKSVKKILGMN